VELIEFAICLAFGEDPSLQIFIHTFLMNRLPDELLLKIITECQPHYYLDISNIFTQPTLPYPEATQVWLNNNGPTLTVSTHNMFNSNRYHKTLVCSYKMMPILVIISQLSFRFRNLALAHPFYSSLNWHYFLKKPIIHKPANYFSKFLNQFVRLPLHFSKTILLDFELFSIETNPNDIKAICQWFLMPNPIA
jgi:hypothetical protein